MIIMNMNDKLKEIEAVITEEELQEFAKEAVNNIRQTAYNLEGELVQDFEDADMLHSFQPSEVMLTQYIEGYGGKHAEALIRGTATQTGGFTITAYVKATEGFNGFDESDVRHMKMKAYKTFKEAYKEWGVK